ncbi:hypothetical protein PR048_005646 [Dryococelus australis]|uniref:Uncharacterized protein n=1 Tax=Dryococelus australis TaxID=614101 RepID=A0ABQ9IA00_9NEOP|nr:hypothetical protein PR048_005646 [Dryococelus australis]
MCAIRVAERVGYPVILNVFLSHYTAAATEFSIQSDHISPVSRLVFSILDVKLKMVRTWIKKTNRRNWDKDKMEAAFHTNLPVHGGRFRKVFAPEQLDELRSYLT